LRSTSSLPSIGIPAHDESHRKRVCDGQAQDGARERLVVANDRQADGLQAALRGIKDLAAPQGHKSVAEGHRRCQIRKWHRGHRRANKPRRLIASSPKILLKDQHQGYITWEQFERNQRVIADNATGKGSGTVKGAVRRGELLLAGLLRCGHCGRKLHVAYSGKIGRYNCYGARANHGTKRCISIGGLGTDAAVSAEVLRILLPLGIDAAVKALEAQATETSAAQRQLELALQQARYEAAHARRQYDVVDPGNRLVAGELERRWNEALQAVHRIEGDIAAIVGLGGRLLRPLCDCRILEARRPRQQRQRDSAHQ
jgi:hypothetical protein